MKNSRLTLRKALMALAIIGTSLTALGPVAAHAQPRGYYWHHHHYHHRRWYGDRHHHHGYYRYY